MYSARYCGRFAPSPTGPLHFGSLVTACASCLEARANGGDWLLRIEDVDRSRCRPEHASAIVETLTRFHFAWDRKIVYQSERADIYDAAFARLGTSVYACSCSRKDLATPGHKCACRYGILMGKQPRAYRIRGTNSIDDFILRREPERAYSYQLAVVADDEEQGVTHVVRGADLLDSTPRQIYLQSLLGYRNLDYLHIPVATGAAGDKLSKQTLATALDIRDPAPQLSQALAFLGQQPPQDLSRQPLADLWRWAIANWLPHRIPDGPSRPAP